MKRIEGWACGALAVVAACTASSDNLLPAPAEALLEHATRIELFALDPLPISMQPPSDKESFHEHAILGRAVLNDRAKCAQLAGLVLQGIRESDGRVAACFNPRHGLRVQTDAHTLELLICYECLSLEAYDDLSAAGVTRSTALTSQSVEPAVTRLFNEAGLTIAGH